MMIDKKLLLRVFFVGEIIFFVVMYLTSPAGLPAVHLRKKENRLLAERIEELTKEVTRLESETKKWGQTTFYREKVAREQLQMARPTDEVYCIS